MEAFKKCAKCKHVKVSSEFVQLKQGMLYAYCYDCNRARNRADYKRVGKTVTKQAREQELHWRRKYGISREQYNILFEAQNGVCAACGCLETFIDARSKRIKMLAVDHCHKTGKIRGLLCLACNQSLGLFNEQPEKVKRTCIGLLRYIQGWSD